LTALFGEWGFTPRFPKKQKSGFKPRFLVKT
jgi:hypothetical protein